VTKDDDKEFSIISKSVVKKKILKFGKVTVNQRKNFMFAFNEVFMVKSGKTLLFMENFSFLCYGLTCG